MPLYFPSIDTSWKMCLNSTRSQGEYPRSRASTTLMIPLPPLHVECLITFPASTLKTMTTSVHSIILHSGNAIVISLFTELGTVRAKSLNATGFETMKFLSLQDA